MIVQPYAHQLILAANELGFIRTDGLHLSDIYGDLFRDLEPDRYAKRDRNGHLLPFDLEKMELGMSFEHALEPTLRQRLLGDRPGEFQSLEGIWFSPDALFFEPPDLRMVLGEFKCTWMSCRDCPISPLHASKYESLKSNWDGVSPVAFPNKFDAWFVQMKGYCRCLDIDEAILIGFFVVGSYPKGFPARPALLAWRLRFTAQELQDNWSMLINHGRAKGMLL